MTVLHAAALVVMLEALAFSVTLPVMNFHCAELGGSAASVGLMFALVSAPKIITNPLLGSLSDRIGRKPVLVASTIGTLAGSLLWALADNLTWLGVSRAITGIMGAQAVVSQAVIADISPPERRAAHVGMLGAAFGIAFALGPPIGGLFASAISTKAIGWLCALFQVVSLWIILRVLPESRPHAARHDSPRGPAFGEILRQPRVPALLLAGGLTTLAIAQLQSSLGLLAERLYRLSEGQTGLLWGLFGLTAVIVQGGFVRRASGRISESTLCHAGAVLAAAGFVLLALTPPWPVLLAGVMLTAIGTALLSPGQSSLLSRAVGPHLQGGLFGLNLSISGIGRAAGQGGGAWLFDQSGVFVTYVVAALLNLAALPFFRPSANGDHGAKPAANPHGPEA